MRSCTVQEDAITAEHSTAVGGVVFCGERHKTLTRSRNGYPGSAMPEHER